MEEDLVGELTAGGVSAGHDELVGLLLEGDGAESPDDARGFAGGVELL